MKRIIIIFAIIINIASNNYAQTELVTSNVLHRVFLIKYQNKYGSAFTLDVDQKQYLISAKHYLNLLKNKDVIEIYHNSRWKKLSVKRIDCKNPNTDITVMAAEIRLSPNLELPAATDHLLLSQDVFFLGFPYMMKTEIDSLNNYFPLPFVKKGIVSAMNFGKKKNGILYIDAQNNTGFSGGPIVFFDYSDKKMKVAAVVSGYRGESSDVYNKKNNTVLKAITNSGIMYGFAIDFAIEAIKNNPIGFDLKM